jgi:O-acetyl-ADP-ribose deacetylase (regulator of RNase III)
VKNPVNSKYIVNFPTKRYWRENSRYEYIDSGLKDLADVIVRLKAESVAIPPLGCGLGGLDWAVVHQLIEQNLAPLQRIKIIVFEPNR